MNIFSKFLLNILLCLVILMIGCDISNTGFYVRKPGEYWINTGKGTYEIRNFVKQEISGKHIEIWVERGMSVDPEDLKKIKDDFDNRIYSTVNNNFAKHSDVDNNGKIAVVIYKGEDSRNKKSYTGGYFNPVDFYKHNNSNDWDAIYVNGSPEVHQPGSNIFSNTIAHEYQHLCNFSRNVMVENRGDYTQMMFTWMDEGLAENAASMSMGEESGGHDRLSYYQINDDIINGERSLTIWENDVGNYTLSYMFFAYIRAQFPNDDIFKKIIDYEEGTNGTADLNTVLLKNAKSEKLKGFNKAMIQFVADLRKKSGFPENFFPSDNSPFNVIEAWRSTDKFRPYSFIYSSEFEKGNDKLHYFDKDGNKTEYDSQNPPKFVIYFDEDIWNIDDIRDGDKISQTSTYVKPSSGVDQYFPRMITRENQVIAQKIDGIK